MQVWRAHDRDTVEGSHALILGAAVLYARYAPLVPVRFST